MFIQYHDTCNPGWHVHAYDDAALSSAVLRTQTVNSPGEAKAIPDGVPIRLDGVIATTGCVGGEVQTRLRLGQYAEARAAAAEFQDIFGKENFYCEIMDHGIDIERRTMSELLALAKDLGSRHPGGPAPVHADALPIRG